MNELLNNLGYQLVTTSVSTEIHAMTEMFAKFHGCTSGECVKYAISDYLSMSDESMQWAEKIKHFQNNLDTYIYDSSEQVQITFTIEKDPYIIIEKLAQCRGMSIVKWIENHLNAFYHGRIDKSRVKKYMSAGRNDNCPCGSNVKFKNCCGPLKNKGERPTCCPVGPYISLVEDNKPLNLCEDVHIYN